MTRQQQTAANVKKGDEALAAYEAEAGEVSNDYRAGFYEGFRIAATLAAQGQFSMLAAYEADGARDDYRSGFSKGFKTAAQMAKRGELHTLVRPTLH